MARLTGKGSEQAFARLYERYHQALFRYCRSILRDDADAQDALQSTFTAALAALQSQQRKAPVRPWLFRIAHNEAISIIRRRRLAGTDLSDTPAQLAASAEERAADRARFAQLIGDLNELPERARAALLMRELSGLSHEEIAIALETSVGAAKQAIFDGRRVLHELAEGRAMECHDIRKQISDGDGRALRSRRLRAHLRDCATCSAFAAAIPVRRAELRALVPPLPAAASAALLSRALSAGSAHGTNTAATGSMTAGALVKAAGTTIASKAVVGVAVVVGAAASVGGVTVALVHAGRPEAHAGRVLSHSAPASMSRHGGNGAVPSAERPPTGRPHRASGSTARPSHHDPHAAASSVGPFGSRGVGKGHSRNHGSRPAAKTRGRHRSGKSARLEPRRLRRGATGRRGAPRRLGARRASSSRRRHGGGARSGSAAK